MAEKVTIVECWEDLPEGVSFPNKIMAVDTETMGLNVHRDRLCVAQVGDGAAPRPFRPAKRVERKAGGPYLPGQADLFGDED